MVKRILLLSVIVLAACTPGFNEGLGVAASDGHIAGFWLGLWHGVILPFTFVLSLFSRSVQIYEVHNSGGWYDLGYIFGLSVVFGGSGHGSARVIRTRRRADG